MSESAASWVDLCQRAFAFFQSFSWETLVREEFTVFSFNSDMVSPTGAKGNEVAKLLILLVAGASASS